MRDWPKLPPESISEWTVDSDPDDPGFDANAADCGYRLDRVGGGFVPLAIPDGDRKAAPPQVRP